MVSEQSTIKLLNYICILVLSLDDFTTTVQVLATDLGLPIDIMKAYFQNIGCTVINQKQTKEQKRKLEEKPKLLATLNAPLNIKYGHKGRMKH